jgi:hypothetical protein
MLVDVNGNATGDAEGASAKAAAAASKKLSSSSSSCLLRPFFLPMCMLAFNKVAYSNEKREDKFVTGVFIRVGVLVGATFILSLVSVACDVAHKV